MAENPLSKPSLRLFLAIPFHEIFLSETARIVEALRYKIRGIKWVRPEQSHLTLHFFGSTPPEQVDRIDSALKEIGNFFAPFSAQLGCFGAFPDPKRANVLWLGIVEKNGALGALHQKIRSELQKAGYETEDRTFSPHITLGRFRSKSDVENILLNSKIEIPDSPKMINHFVLYQSHCLPEGARYEVLKKYSLKKKTQS